MAFYHYLNPSTVINLNTTDKVEALTELSQILCRNLKIRKHKPIIDEILKREEAASTFIGQGIAIPYTIAPIDIDFAIIFVKICMYNYIMNTV